MNQPSGPASRTPPPEGLKGSKCCVRDSHRESRQSRPDAPPPAPALKAQNAPSVPVSRDSVP